MKDPLYAEAMSPSISPNTPDITHDTNMSLMDRLNLSPITEATGLRYIIEVPISP